MGESWKPSHDKKASVHEIASQVVRDIPDIIKAAPEPYKGPERRVEERRKKRWSFGIYIGMTERAGK